MLQLIFIFITTSSLPKQNKLSKNCDSNNNNNEKSKSFLKRFTEYKRHQTLQEWLFVCLYVIQTFDYMSMFSIVLVILNDNLLVSSIILEKKYVKVLIIFY